MIEFITSPEFRGDLIIVVIALIVLFYSNKDRKKHRNINFLKASCKFCGTAINVPKKDAGNFKTIKCPCCSRDLLT